MTKPRARATEAIRAVATVASAPFKAAAAPLMDRGEDGPSFSKTVAAVVVLVWSLTILARVVVGLVTSDAAHVAGVAHPPTLLPGFTWQDVAVIALVIIASHGRSMVRSLVNRTTIGLGGPVTVGSESFTGAYEAPAPAKAPETFAESLARLSGPHGATPGPSRSSLAGNLYEDDERGDYPEREVVNAGD